MKGQLSMGINQHSNVNLQGFELLRFFASPENLPLSQKNIFLTENSLNPHCNQGVVVLAVVVVFPLFFFFLLTHTYTEKN